MWPPAGNTGMVWAGPPLGLDRSDALAARSVLCVVIVVMPLVSKSETRFGDIWGKIGHSGDGKAARSGQGWNGMICMVVG